MHARWFLALLGFGALAGPADAAAQRPDTVAFIARLGVDTVAVERVVRTTTTLEADVVIRSPRTTLFRHQMTLDAAGNLARLEASVLDPGTGAVQRQIIYTRSGDSLRIEDRRGDQRTLRAVLAPAAALPFIDLVHWPFDVALRRMRTAGQTRHDAPFLSGQRAVGFPLAFMGADSATVTHPTRGTMRLTVAPDGGITTLDAGATTRALIVSRGAWPDVPAMARHYAAMDAAGRGVGELSGRGLTKKTVLGADFEIDYGVPLKRGREIWGALVRYGQVWRTGANRATHLTTSRDLHFGDLHVPAGTYTLFSIPEEAGGLLIINRQTGQNGQSYDEARDLGRVRLTARPLPEVVEAFTITVDEENGRGLLRLQWDRKELVAAFTVGR
jgi:hypothetical protein